MTIVMTTTGSLYGLVVLAGLLAGLWLRGRVERRQRQPLSTEPTVPRGEPGGAVALNGRRISIVDMGIVRHSPPLMGE